MILKRFIFVLLFFIFVIFGFFIFAFGGTIGQGVGQMQMLFFFFWVFCIKILFLTNKFSIIYFVRVMFSCVDISFDKTYFTYNWVVRSGI